MLNYMCETLYPDSGTFVVQGRHKAQLRGSARVLSTLAEGLPLSLQTLATVPAKREHVLLMLGTLRQRHRFHLQVRPPPLLPPLSLMAPIWWVIIIGFSGHRDLSSHYSRALHLIKLYENL